MNTLWTFGDSFTAGWGCTPEFEYYKKYYKEGDKLWTELLADEMGLPLLNIGKNAASNDYIIDSIILNWKKIKKNDFVVIGKTFTHRFDIPIKKEFTSIFDIPVSIENRWVTILDKFSLDNGYNLFNKEEFETIVNFNYLFAANPLYKERQDLRYDFLVKQLKEKNIKVYLWDVLSHAKLKFNTIQMDTNNELIDGHFSFKGHVEFYKWISKKIKNENKII
jgi:lysophospholipase L1-like esterase